MLKRRIYQYFQDEPNQGNNVARNSDIMILYLVEEIKKKWNKHHISFISISLLITES